MIAKKKVTKAKNGKSFPDLNKDGKITKADILKGRGVIAKKGASVRKAGLGDVLGKVAKVGGFGLAGMAANKLFGGKKKAAAPGMAPAGAPAAPMAAPAVATPPMKKGGKVSAIKKKMQYGGKAASMASPKPKYPAKLPVKSSTAKPKVGTRMVTLGVDGSMMKSGGKMKKCKYGCK